MSFTENTVVTASMHDPTINCDMVTEYNRIHIKAIVYSDLANSASATPTATLYAEDGYGHSDSYTLPDHAIHPDVVVGCYQILGYYLVYQAIVTYTLDNDLKVEVYDLQDIGLSSFYINTTPVYSVTPSTSCIEMTHIDMWPDYGGPGGVPFLSNLLSMHQFAVVYTDANTGLLNAYVNDIFSWNTSATAFNIGGGYAGGNPDIACQVAPNGDQHFFVAYEGNPAVIHRTTPAYGYDHYYCQCGSSTSLKVLEYDYTAGSVVSNGTKVSSTGIYAPRIEAIGDFTLGTRGYNPEYQVAYNHKGATPGYDQVRGYNPVIGSPQLISNLDFPAPYSCMSACVAAGPLVNNPYYSSCIGNLQYTMGFYPWSNGLHVASANIYERNINMAGGAFVNTNTYQANTNPLNFYWDINRNMAISNVSNLGEDILSAWYNGTDIVWKESTPDVMAFRMLGAGGKPSKLRLHIGPVPTTDVLHIDGLASTANYTVSDLSGKAVLMGTLRNEASINVSSLPAGHYMLGIKEEGKEAESTRFIKQ